MKKIHIRFMKDLKNIEFEELFLNLTTTLKREKVYIPSLLMAVERLESHSKELSRVIYKKMEHPLTQLIQTQVATRTEYLGSLRLGVESKMLSHKLDERIAAKRLSLWLRTYKKEIYSPTIYTQSNLIKNLMHDREENIEIQQATALLYLDELLEAIVSINATVMRNILKQLNEKDIYSVDGKAIRDAVYKALRVVVTAIEASYNIGTDEKEKEELSELTLSINEDLKVFRRQLRSRNTKRENEKGVEVAVVDFESKTLVEKPLDSKKTNWPVVRS